MSDIKSNLKSKFKLLIDTASQTTVVKLISYTIIFTVICVFIIYLTYTLKKQKSNCNKINSLYKNFPKFSSIDLNNPTYKFNLRDYYIKTAYNACSSGNIKNDYVNVCALKNAIKQGARCLDFAIYSLNNKPVIALSNSKDFYTKTVYNSIDFDEAMNIVSNYAFSYGTCPNSNDPLLLHFRIMSNNKPIYNIMAKSLQSILHMRLLDKQYSYEYSGNNLGNVPLSNLTGKVIIMVDKMNPLYKDTPLNEYVNIASSSVFLRNYNFSQIKNIQDFNELIEYNKKNMSIITPDISSKIVNPSAALCMTYGCQMIAMQLQKKDSNLDYYNTIFEGQNCAFVLKPVNLRYIPVTMPAPSPPDPKLGFGTRTFESKAYSFKM